MNPFSPRATWGRGWIAPHEGAFTIAQKYAWANAATVLDMRRLLGMPSTRLDTLSRASSLLVDVNTPERSPLKCHFMSYWAGAWTRLLASDEHFRYCPQCIQYGFQSYIHQIVEIARCPIHRCELLSVCSVCGQPTCEYGLTTRAFSMPLHCDHCAQPWAGTLQISRWNEQSWAWSSYGCLEVWSLWLRRLEDIPLLRGTSLDHLLLPQTRRGEIAMFADNFNSRARTGEAQRIAFAAASALSIRLDTDDVLLAPPAYWRFVVSQRQPEAAKAATGREHDKPDAKRIYKCIRRNIQRRYLRDRRSALRGPRRHADTPPPHFGADPLVETFIWWRSHFEKLLGKPTEQEKALLHSVAGDPELEFSGFFQQAFVDYFDGEANHDVGALPVLFAASFYSAASRLLERCIDLARTPLVKYDKRESVAAIEEWCITHWQRQLANPCWLRLAYCGDAYAARWDMQFATFTGTPQTVLTLRRWRWEESRPQDASQATGS